MGRDAREGQAGGGRGRGEGETRVRKRKGGEESGARIGGPKQHTHTHATPSRQAELKLGESHTDR